MSEEAETKEHEKCQRVISKLLDTGANFDAGFHCFALCLWESGTAGNFEATPTPDKAASFADGWPIH